MLMKMAATSGVVKTTFDVIGVSIVRWVFLTLNISKILKIFFNI